MKMEWMQYPHRLMTVGPISKTVRNMEMTFMDNRVNNLDAKEGAAGGAAVGSVVPVIGTAIGGLVGGITGALSDQSASKSGIENWLRTHGGNARLPYYPSKA